MIKGAIISTMPKNRLENTINGFGGKDTYTGQTGDYLDDDPIEITYVEAAKSVITNLEKTLLG